MKRLLLKPSQGGELAVWERPLVGSEYIVTCDPSLGRNWTESGDMSAIGVWRREHPRMIVQTAEWVGRWPVGRVGEVIACLSRAYGGWVDQDGREQECATINIERNLMDTPKFAIVDIQGLSENFFFVPREHRAIRPGDARVYFTTKDAKSEQYLINTMSDYLDRKAVIIRSEQTRDELMSLERDRTGSVKTNGKDRSVMAILACVTDQELPAARTPEVEPKQKKEPDKVRGMTPAKASKADRRNHGVWSRV